MASTLPFYVGREVVMHNLRLALFAVTIASGCANNPYFRDNEGQEPPSGSLTEHADELSQPYAQGSDIHISIGNVDRDEVKGLKITSDSDAVLRVDKLVVNDNDITAECTATGAGETTIHLIDANGAERRKAQIVVRTADRARLFAHGLVRIAGRLGPDAERGVGRDDTTLASAEVAEMRMLTGGKAVFAVAYFNGTERLYGHGIAETEQAAELAVERKTSSDLPANEWLFVTPNSSGSSQLKVLQKGRTLGLLPVFAVPDTELSAVSLVEEVTPKKDEKQRIWVYARAKDSQQRDVHGVYCTWSLDGVAQTHSDDPMKLSGDFYRYYLGRDTAPSLLAAACKSLSAQLEIRATAGDDKGHKGGVNDTTYLGCSFSAGGRTTSPSPAWAALLLLPLLMRLRRRPASV